MKNLKELAPILKTIMCINRTNGHEDKDITKLLDYAFNRFFGSNINLLLVLCVGQTKESMMPVLNQMLKEDTKYFELGDNKNE